MTATDPRSFFYRSLHCPCGTYGFYAYRDDDGRLFFRCMHCFVRIDFPESAEPPTGEQAAAEATAQREFAEGQERKREIRDPLGSMTPLHFPEGRDRFRG